VPPYLQRFQADDLLAAVFPAQVGCLENHSGDVPIPDHPLVNQTTHDCLHEAMDLDGWMELLQQAERGRADVEAEVDAAREELKRRGLVTEEVDELLNFMKASREGKYGRMLQARKTEQQ